MIGEWLMGNRDFWLYSHVWFNTPRKAAESRGKPRKAAAVFEDINYRHSPKYITTCKAGGF